ncbi:MAG: HAD hydrolase-like protein [Akkermansia sp.]|nr:HAD hydrolase-like protein [Akkermansia sp.]
MFKNLIFDWSGTLCDDLALTLEATNYVLAQYDRPALTREQFRDEFQLPYPDYYARKTPEARLVDLEKYYRHAFDHAVTQVTIIPHARAFMEFCRKHGIRCFILTSMDPRAFDEQARFLGLKDYFEHIHSGVRNKEEYIYNLLRQHELNPADTAFIGDMQHDINAAHSAGIIGIGVLTGYNNAAQLAVSNPDLTVPHLGALQSLMERSGSRVTTADSIHINGLEFTCRIGVPEEERAVPQRLMAHITLTPPAAFADMAEDISRTIDYDALSRHLMALAQAEPTILLETLCRRLADACVQDFGAASATVELHKFILPFTQSVSVRCTV